MRFFVLLVLAVMLVAACGCSSSPYSFANPTHVGHHFSCIYNDIHNLHVDIDHVVFGIYEETQGYRLKLED